MTADGGTTAFASPVMLLAAWLLTYSVHSTLLTAGVWLLDSRFRSLSSSLKELLWKVALLGSLLTASVQVGLGLEPFSGRLTLRSSAVEAGSPASPPAGAVVSVDEAQAPDDDAAAATGAALATLAARDEPAAGRPRRGPQRRGVSSTHDVPDAGAGPVAVAAERLRATARGVIAAVGPRGLVALWLAGALLFLGRLILGRVGLHRRLGERRLVVDPHLLHTLEHLRRQAGHHRDIHLTSSAHAWSPMALRASEIVLPERALTDLTVDEQESMLAHEVAHIARRDPMWLLIAGVVESLFFFQPLHRVGRRCFQETTEFLCDAWAVSQTGRRLTLARCLAQVAGWLERPHPVPIACMARLGSPLVRRVQRLLEESRMDLSQLSFRTRTLAVLLPLALIAWLAPGVTAGDDAPATSRFHYAGDDGRDLEIRSRGRVEIDEDEGVIREVSPDGYYRVSDDADGTSRWLEVTSRDGRLQHHYRVNGRTVEFDAEGEAWLAGILEERRRRREERETLRRELDAHRQDLATLRAEQQRRLQDLREAERELVTRTRERVRELSDAERLESERERAAQQQAREDYRRQLEHGRDDAQAGAAWTDRQAADAAYRQAMEEIRAEHRQAATELRERQRQARDEQRDADRAFREATRRLGDVDDTAERDRRLDRARQDHEQARQAASEALRAARQREAELERDAEDRARAAREAYDGAVRDDLEAREVLRRTEAEDRRRAAASYQEAIQQLQDDRGERQRRLQDEQRAEIERLQDELRALQDEQRQLQHEWQQRLQDEREDLRRRLEDEGIDADVPLPVLAPMPPLPSLPGPGPSVAVAPMPPVAPDPPLGLRGTLPMVEAPPVPPRAVMPRPAAPVVLPGLPTEIMLPPLPPLPPRPETRLLHDDAVIAPDIDRLPARLRVRGRAPGRLRPPRPAGSGAEPEAEPGPETPPAADDRPEPAPAPRPRPI